MHSSILALFLAVASCVSAQAGCDPVASAIPDCGVPCIEDAAAGFGCTGSDYACRCDNSAAIENAALGCVLGECGLGTALEVRASASAVCDCVATAVPAA
ncbi:hypothetical protein BDW02DRAFT_597168 [Decorospora gaudefroyi]|uniref:CFEM domain-containing protein n=1 Tax=Decorospora gaudefroyi TaxID=184978 RepID=A0A6A5KHC6_9PLEO|nr:hypothetical protein BDW02DRAFT_597168 [Decorospora gaudefroyi]